MRLTIDEKKIYFKIREIPTKKCKEKDLTLNRHSTKHTVAYFSHVDEEEAIKNFQAYLTFLNCYEVVLQVPGNPKEHTKPVQLGKDLQFEFWRKFFIKKKFSVQAEVDVPELPLMRLWREITVTWWPPTHRCTLRLSRFVVRS